MERKSFLVYAGMILAVICMLVLAGCPQEPEKDEGIDGRLAYSWTNDPNSSYTVANNLIGLKKTFAINKDSTFSASINVIFLSACAGAQVNLGSPDTTVVAGIAAGMGGGGVVDALKWEVTGKLVEVADEIYLMEGLTAAGPNGQGQLEDVTPAIVTPFATEPVKLHVVDDTHFTFEGASTDGTTNVQINNYFGGSYTKVVE
jgi:hypothetical protein